MSRKVAPGGIAAELLWGDSHAKTGVRGAEFRQRGSQCEITGRPEFVYGRQCSGSVLSQGDHFTG